VNEEFAARRRTQQDRAIDRLLPLVQRWLDRPDDPAHQVPIMEALTRLYLDTYLDEGGERRARTAAFLASLQGLVRHTESGSDPRTVATWLAVSALNAAGLQAAADDEAPLLLQWTTMHDSAVRPAHVAAEGQLRPPGSRFTVGGESLRYPGDPRGRIDNTICCRCVLAPVPVSTSALTAAMKEFGMTYPLDAPLAWHGVLAPEEEWSGDGRRFSAGSLRSRDLPLPLTWQRASGEGHDGSVVVARIDTVERVDGMMRGEGVFIDTPETDQVVGLIAEFGRFGVSVDADDSEFEFDEESNKITFTSARIASASLVAIPAFASAFVALGTWAEADDTVTAAEPPSGPIPPQDDSEQECDPSAPDYEDCLARKAQDVGMEVPASALDGEFVSEKPWNGSAERFSPEQWKRSTILHVCDGMEKSCHKLPIREPGGQLSRAGVHAAASRLNQVDAPAEAKSAAKRKLRGAYRQLGEDVPDGLASAGETDEFGRGPGWLTNPEDTRRIWAYWTKPGHEGYEKIGWGTPGDFNRCRAEVGEEIGEESPEKLRFLNQICSQWHHDATGFWPGRAPTERAGSAFSQLNGPSITLVADAGQKAPATWFQDPKLSAPTHLTVTEDGRVFGHLAAWRTCHVGFDGVCVAPPASASKYAYFATGQVLLDNGEQASTGVISLGGGHAGARVGARAAAAHYDSTSAAVADVSVGEDEHGIWCAGWVRPGVSQEQVTALRASDVSGDWREIAGNLELVAALAVNVAGFPVAAVHDRVQVALVAAGAIQEPEDMFSALVRRAIQTALVQHARMERLKARVGAR
jgi:hypothetical protein